MAEERTEQASPRRRQQAREQGDRPRSRDLVAAAATLAGTLVLGGLTPRWLAGWRAAFSGMLRLSATDAWRSESGVAPMLALRTQAFEAMLPLTAVLLAGAAAALAAGVVQGGGVTVHFPVLQPKWTRIDPLTNLKNLFSLRALSRLAKTLIPVAALTVFALQKLLRQTEMPVFSLTRLPETMTSAYDLLVAAAWILFLWSAVDYAVEWRSWDQRLRMSKQELREEYKSTEGNPQVRGRIRNLQRQMRARMLRADVARASVVITNPTHYAVALSFDFATMDAPRVLAKGRNLVAEQIKTEARWAGVPIVENPPLARSLYRTVETGHPIPYELYATVAGILAYLYRQQVEERIRQQAAAARQANAAAASPYPAAARPTAEANAVSEPGAASNPGAALNPEAASTSGPAFSSAPAGGSGQAATGRSSTPASSETKISDQKSPVEGLSTPESRSPASPHTTSPNTTSEEEIP